MSRNYCCAHPNYNRTGETWLSDGAFLFLHLNITWLEYRKSTESKLWIYSYAMSSHAITSKSEVKSKVKGVSRVSQHVIKAYSHLTLKLSFMPSVTRSRRPAVRFAGIRIPGNFVWMVCVPHKGHLLVLLTKKM